VIRPGIASRFRGKGQVGNLPYLRTSRFAGPVAQVPDLREYADRRSLAVPRQWWGTPRTWRTHFVCRRTARDLRERGTGRVVPGAGVRLPCLSKAGGLVSRSQWILHRAVARLNHPAVLGVIKTNDNGSEQTTPDCGYPTLPGGRMKRQRGDISELTPTGATIRRLGVRQGATFEALLSHARILACHSTLAKGSKVAIGSTKRAIQRRSTRSPLPAQWREFPTCDCDLSITRWLPIPPPPDTAKLD
jgi:hypothetical protein